MEGVIYSACYCGASYLLGLGMGFWKGKKSCEAEKVGLLKRVVTDYKDHLENCDKGGVPADEDYRKMTVLEGDR